MSTTLVRTYGRPSKPSADALRWRLCAPIPSYQPGCLILPQPQQHQQVLPNMANTVGSLHVPTRASVTAIQSYTVLNAVAKLASEAGVKYVERHNAYTAYVAFFLLATTGLRGVSSLLPAHFDIDRATGLCFVSHKDNESYEQSRIVWLHPMLLDQLRAYSQHVTRLRQYLALANPEGIDHLDARDRLISLSSHTAPNRNRDLELLRAATPSLFLLTKHGSQLTPTFPLELQHLLGSTWQLRIGALRHFFRTEPLHLGVPGPVINAMLGHGERGEDPWWTDSVRPSPAVATSGRRGNHQDL